jgi:hypothetical protein
MHPGAAVRSIAFMDAFPPTKPSTALDPDATRIIARRYAKDNMNELISRLTTLREHLLANGWDGKVAA